MRAKVKKTKKANPTSLATAWHGFKKFALLFLSFLKNIFFASLRGIKNTGKLTAQATTNGYAAVCNNIADKKNKLVKFYHAYSLRKLKLDVSAAIGNACFILAISAFACVVLDINFFVTVYTCTIISLISALLGSNIFLISSPTPTLLIISLATIKFYGFDVLALSTFIAGIILLLMSMLRAGAAFKYVPYPVGFGLNLAIAILLFGSQIKNILGFAEFDYDGNMLQSLTFNIRNYFNHMEEINIEALLIASIAFLIALGLRNLRERLPYFLITLMLAAAGMYFFKFDVGLINASEFFITDFNPPLMWKVFGSFNASQIWNILPTAFTVALVIAVDTILAAVVVDNVTSKSHSSNRELFTLGAANTASALLCGLPMAGSITASMTNVNNGAQSIIAKLLTPLVTFALVFVLKPAFPYIPTAAVAALVMLMALMLILQKETFISVFRSTKSDLFVFVTTLIITLFAGVMNAILWGIFTYAILFIKNSHAHSDIETYRTSRTDILEGRPKIPNVEVIAVSGPLFFGSFSNIYQTMQNLSKRLKVLVLKMDNVKNIDISIFKSLETFIHNCAEEDIDVILTNLAPKPLKILEGAQKRDGRIIIAASLNEAYRLAQKLLKTRRN